MWLYLAAGAARVVIPSAPPVVIRNEADLSRIDGLTLRPASAPIISAQQQGTVRFATSAARGGADPTGQVFGTRVVYVMDASVFPSSASSHTMTPIITIARYLASRLAAGQ